MNSHDMERITLRAPADLLVELRIMAARARRSLNAQIVCLLEEASSKNEKADATAS